jgi:hypothetical protein
MSTPWLTLFEKQVEEEMLASEKALLGGHCRDYTAYRVEAAKLETFAKALDLARGLDDNLIKGVQGASHHSPSDD